MSEQNELKQEPVAWMIPMIISFKGAKKTSCPEHLQAEIEGTVAWSADVFCDSEPVKDKFGVIHEPYQLCRYVADERKTDEQIIRIAESKLSIIFEEDEILAFARALMGKEGKS